ncbi:MAG: MBG domain-containing protein, partial [Opitutia bacterium]
MPTGGRVESGSASIASGPSSLVVTQSSQRLAVGWDSFSIGAGSAVQFVQPSATSLAVNVVRGSDPSVIAGSLTANGRVVLVNPQGIAFAAGSQVNVGSLVASGLRDAAGDFASGRTTLSGAGGEVSNAGVITVARGGSAVLAGSRVTNTGHILADSGKVVLAAGSSLSLDYAGDSLITLAVDAGAVEAAVSNGGAIRVGSGRILLTAKSANALAASVVRNSGELQASSIVERGGEVWLTADVVGNSGAIEATSATGQGGEAHLVGAKSVSVTGTIDVSGGAKGGFVDVSAPAVLLPDLFQVKVGRGGHFLLDPDNITINAGGSPVTADPTQSDPVSDITLSKFSIETWLAGGSDLTIEALNAGSITVASSITVVAPGAGALALETAGGAIDIQQAISTTGALSLTTGGTGAVTVSANVTSSNLAIIAGGDLNLESDLTTTVGELNLQVGGDLVLDGDLDLVSAAGVNVNLAGDVLTNVSSALGGSTFVLTSNGGTTLEAVGWLASDLTTKSLDLAGNVSMQYGFSSGFGLPDAEDLAFVPSEGTKYPDPYLNQTPAPDSGLQDGDTLADVVTAPNLSLSWTGSTPTATSASGSTFGYSITLGTGFTLDKPGYVIQASADTGTLTVRPRELLVKPDDLSGNYGSFPTPSKYLYQVTGFQNGDTLASLGITGEALTGSTYDASSSVNRGAGAYVITVAQNTLAKGGDAAGNYAFNLQPGALTIAKAPLLLRAKDESREYGEANPTLVAEEDIASGDPTQFKYGDTLATALSGALSLTTTATATSDVGDYVIDLSQGTAASANYEVTLVDGTLVIDKAPLTVTMLDATKVYGDALAATYPYEMTGFKNGQDEATLRGAGTLSGTVEFTSTATQSSAVGLYTLTPTSGSLTARNYAFVTF